MTATQWLEVLTSYSLQVFVVILAGWVLERSVASTADRCAIWNICFFSILILGGVAVLLPRLHLIQPWSQLRPQALLSFSAAQAVIGKCLLAVWCLGASVAILKWVARGHFMRRLLNRCEQIPPHEVRQLLHVADSKVTNQILPRLLISDLITGPFCCQLHHPVIVLPRFLLDGSREELRHVLVHELEHLKTNHPVHLFLQNLAQVVCWFHPAVGCAARRASLTREFVCDDAAAAQGADSAAYLRTLLHIAERCEQGTHAPAIGFGRTPSEIVLRAHRMVDLSNPKTSKNRRGWMAKRMAICVLLLIAGLMTQIWIPSDPLASSRSIWSPWPTWTAKSLHCFGLCVRDYEPFDSQVQLFELQRDYSSN
jgi:beta-lactamase regulating signal transducer with metallopeptidase domain